jgi:hypothetical protein
MHSVQQVRDGLSEAQASSISAAAGERQEGGGERGGGEGRGKKKRARKQTRKKQVSNRQEKNRSESIRSGEIKDIVNKHLESVNHNDQDLSSFAGIISTTSLAKVISSIDSALKQLRPNSEPVCMVDLGSGCASAVAGFLAGCAEVKRVVGIEIDEATCALSIQCLRNTFADLEQAKSYLERVNLSL